MENDNYSIKVTKVSVQVKTDLSSTEEVQFCT